MRNINLNNLKLICFIIFPSAAIIGCKDFNKQESQSAPYPSEIFNKTEIQKFNKELEVSMEKAAHDALIKSDRRKAFRDEIERLCEGEILWTKNLTYSIYIDENKVKDSIMQNSQFVIGNGFYKVMANGEDWLLYKQTSAVSQFDRDGIRFYTAGVIDRFGNEGELTLIGNNNGPTKLVIKNNDKTTRLFYD
jgi:hypothetical protein